MPGNSQLRTSGVCKSAHALLAMRFLREMVLSLLVVGVVLCLYFVAAGTALLALSGFNREPQPVHRLKMAAT
jgi:hypothetical protein